MTLITVRRRLPKQNEVSADLSPVIGHAGRGVVVLASVGAAWLAWQRLGGAPNPGFGIAAYLERGQVLPLPLLGLVSPLILLVGLRMARVLARGTWVLLWAALSPWLLLSLTWLLDPVYLVLA